MADRLDDPMLYDYVKMQIAYHKIHTTIVFDPPIQHRARTAVGVLEPILALLEGDLQPIEQRLETLTEYFSEQFPDWEEFVKEIDEANNGDMS